MLLERHIAYVLILPTIIGILLVDFYPLLYNLWISFQERKISSAVAPFVGLRNYSRIIGDPEVWNAIRVSLIFTFGSVLFSFLIGFGLALLLNRQFRGRGAVRSIFIVPWAMPPFAALVWPGCSTTSSGSSPPSSAISACEPRSGWGATGRSGR